MPSFTLTVQFEAASLTEAEAQAVKVEALGLKCLSLAPSAEPVTIIYTDGGCTKAGALGAWAYIRLTPGDPDQSESGTDPTTTNNRMELEAVIRGLQKAPVGIPVIVYTDSEYVLKGSTIWAKNWVANGWKTREGNPVANQDLWELLIALYQLHDVRFVHVKGHNRNLFNEKCDKLCTDAMLAAGKAPKAMRVSISEEGSVF